MSAPTAVTSSQFRVVSTFAGCGGSSLGYTMAGGKVLLAVEWDDHAVATYAANFPDTDIYHGDIAKLSVEECLKRTGLRLGELDILDGSPPCQGFSTAGKRRFDDPRNQLFREYVRLLRGLQPRVFVMENVGAMVRGKMKLIFADILRELKASGYRVRVRRMNAMYYGVPQSRERMIFIGVRDDLGIEPSHPKPQTTPITLREAIGDLPPYQVPQIGHVWVDEAGKTQTWRKAVRAEPGQKYAGHARRLRWDRPAGTLTTSGLAAQGAMRPYLRNSNCHPQQTRTLSMREYARLSTFPDWFKFPGEWWQGIHRIGNSVPPRFMQAIAQHVRDEILARIEAGSRAMVHG